VRGASPPVIYWDASAVLSALFQDERSSDAHAYAGRESVHLMSTLGFAEILAVVSRLRRERQLADLLLDAALESLDAGPWRILRLAPLEAEIRGLTHRSALRGADLWHLAAVRTLAHDLPEVRMLTFDRRLHAAACAEGVSC